MHAESPPNPWTRRELLRAGLAATGVALLPGSVPAADTPEPGAYGPFKMGLQSYSLRHFKFHDALEKTKDLGLHYWESYNAHIPTDTAKAEANKKLAERHGVQVVGYGVVHLTKDRDANRKFFEFAKAIGVGYLSADPDLDAFDTIDKLVEEYGVPVGIHNHGPGHKFEKIDAIAAAIKDHHQLIGCCIDTGHFLRSREDPVRAVEVFDRRIYGVHLKDVKDATQFTVLGRGDMRTADLLKALASRKYSYCLALEYEEHEEDPIADIEACLAAVKAALPKA